MEAIICSLQVAIADHGLIVTDEIIKGFIEENIDELVKEIRENL